MPNILFVSNNDVNLLNGGIDKVVDTLSGEFIKQAGYKCFLAYLNGTHSSSTAFEGKIKIDRTCAEQICKDFIVTNQINIILVNLLVADSFKFIMPVLYSIAKEQVNCKIVFVYHNQPGFEKEKMKTGIYLNRIFHGQHLLLNLKNLAIQTVSGLLGEKIIRYYFIRKYSIIYKYSDKVVLLSPSHIPLFAHCAGVPITDKLTAIGNALSFPAAIEEEAMKRKEKLVLIVSRLDEKQKRISLALKIWGNIERSGKYNDWKLTIVGSGEDERYYKETAKKRCLKQISFEGAHSPKLYYEKASIFLMTSAYEGFCLTLTESLQMGVVPVVFDSFSAVHDIIDDEYNGFLIPDNDMMAYTNRLSGLMDNNEQRYSMAQNAIDSSKRFETSKIVKQWLNLFDELLKPYL